MKALRAIALLALPFAAVRGEADNALSHTRPVVIDDLALLDPGKLVSPAYLFDSVVTNGGNDSRGKYIPRNHGFVDLDKDGHEDVIISAPLSEFTATYSAYLPLLILKKPLLTGQLFGTIRTTQGVNHVYA